MTHTIHGNWKAGWALDLHTTSSVKLPNGKFDNTYSTTGNALNRLKYHDETIYIDNLVQELVTFMNTRLVTRHLAVIVPAPASKDRALQPVYEIAKRVARRLNLPYDESYLKKIKNTAELKSIDCPDERSKLLSGAFHVDSCYKGKKVLIIDDLFRSGSTLKELTKTMYNVGSVDNVYVVTLTKTRVHR